MRHRVQGRKLGRTSAHRKALFRNQLTALFTHERIITTLAKAKELRPIAERMVTTARTGTLAARRRVAVMVQDKDVARRLFEEIAPRFENRPGGYTRIMRLGRRRGDNAELAIIEFVDYELADHRDESDSGAGKSSFLDKAKGVFGGGAKAEAGAEEKTATETEEAAEPADAPEPEEAAASEAAAEDAEAEPSAAEVPEVPETADDAEPAEAEATEAEDEGKKDA